MGETIDTILNLPAKYDELSVGLAKRLAEDFSHFGLGLSHVYINAITPPPEVQNAIDDRSRMGVFQDMNKLMQMKAAMAMEKASEAEGGAGDGMGMGLGLMLPAMFAQYFTGEKGKGGQAAAETTACPECRNHIADQRQVLPLVRTPAAGLQQCANCGKNLTPNAKFCSRCGKPAEDKPEPTVLQQVRGRKFG